MADAIEWVGMIVFSIILGGFLGFVITEGGYLSAAAGAGVLIVLSAIYLLTIADGGRPKGPASH